MNMAGLALTLLITIITFGSIFITIACIICIRGEQMKDTKEIKYSAAYQDYYTQLESQDNKDSLLRTVENMADRDIDEIRASVEAWLKVAVPGDVWVNKIADNPAVIFCHYEYKY